MEKEYLTNNIADYTLFSVRNTLWKSVIYVVLRKIMPIEWRKNYIKFKVEGYLMKWGMKNGRI